MGVLSLSLSCSKVPNMNDTNEKAMSLFTRLLKASEDMLSGVDHHNAQHPDSLARRADIQGERVTALRRAVQQSRDFFRALPPTPTASTPLTPQHPAVVKLLDGLSEIAAWDVDPYCDDPGDVQVKATVTALLDDYHAHLNPPVASEFEMMLLDTLEAAVNFLGGNSDPQAAQECKRRLVYDLNSYYAARRARTVQE